MGECRDIYAPLWITQLTRYAYIDRVVERYGLLELGPYIFVFLLLFIDTGVLSTIGYLLHGNVHPLVDNPFWYAAPVGLWFAIWGIRMITQRYYDIITGYDFRERFADPEVTAASFYDVRQTRIKHVLFAVLLAVHLTNLMVFGQWEEVVEFEGQVIGFLKFGIIVPFGYFPIIVEFAGLVLASMVLVPRYLVKHEYRLQFDDPLDIGGLELVGDLIKQSFYIYTIGLLLAIVFTYGPFVFAELANNEYTPPGFWEALEFTLAWLLGISLVLYSTYTLHTYMQRSKRNKVEEIDGRIRQLGTNDRGLPDIKADETAYSELEIEHLRLQKVKNTHTWPFTAAAQERILFSALFPMALELVLTTLL